MVHFGLGGLHKRHKQCTFAAVICGKLTKHNYKLNKIIIMKTVKFFSFLAMAAALSFAACKPNVPTNNTDGPGNGNNGKGTTTSEAINMPESIVLPEGAITVSEARAIGAELQSGQVTEQKYYIHGWIKKLASKHADGMNNYGNALFYMSEKMYKGAEGEMTFDKDDFYGYQIYAGEDKKQFGSLDEVQVGDYVVIYTYITNYNGTIETPGSGDTDRGYMVASSNSNFGKAPEIPELDNDNDGTQEKPYTVADVQKLNSTSKGPHWVKGYIVGVVDGKNLANGAKFEAAAVATNLIIAANAEETNIDNVIPVALPKGYIRDLVNLQDNPGNLGKEVLLYGTLEKYFSVAGVKEVSKAYIDGQEVVKPADVEKGKVTIAEFLAAGASNYDWYELTGTITDEGCDGDKMKFEMEKYGDFMLVDETGSVYVYGIAAEKGGTFSKDMGLKKGDKITIKGLRTVYNENPQVGSAYLISINNDEEGGEGNGEEGGLGGKPIEGGDEGEEPA